MSIPLVRVAPVRLWVGDTGPLMQEVVQAVSRAVLTSMLAALDHDTARLYVARHVLTEVERDLPGYAESRGVDPARALAMWKMFYLPYVVVVDIPPEWGQLDDRVAQVAARHLVDLPTAQLAAALAPCHALVDDADLADHGIGNRQDPRSGASRWLVLAHGSANQAQLDMAGGAVWVPSVLGAELAKGAVSLLTRLPDWAKVTVALAAGAILYWWQASGRASEQLGRARTLAHRVGEVVLPIAATIVERALAAEQSWRENVVVTGPVTLAERIARRLALADDPMTAAELAREIEDTGSLRSRETAIRQELRSCPAFTQASRGRWRLGSLASDREPAVTPELVVAWLRRAHGRQPQAAPLS